ncbi:MAG: hypothetical protein R2789_08735 [Microthrixaceae bacterium]
MSIVIPTAGVSGDVDGSQRCYVETLLRSLVPTLGTEDEVLVVSGPEAPPNSRPSSLRRPGPTRGSPTSWTTEGSPSRPG